MIQDHLKSNANELITSVCVCTCRRPEGLRRLLESLAGQVDAPAFEVVVIDNDRMEAGREIVEAFRDRLCINYIVDSESCLAGARNRSIREAKGEYLAFIDDDEEASPAWLKTHHRIMTAYGAAVVSGAAEIVFSPGVPVAVRSCRIFLRKHFPAEGKPLPWYWAFTGNAYVRKSALPDHFAPFQIKFGSTGGEDVDCFKKIFDAGGLILASGTEARVREYREYERANYAWVVRRSIRNGGNLADMQWQGVSWYRKMRLAGRSFGQAVVDGWRAYRWSRKDAGKFVDKSIDAGEQLGRFLSFFGYRYPEYGSRR